MVLTLEDLVKQYGTNFLQASLCPGTVIRVRMYGRYCQVVVTEDGRSAEFSVDQESGL